MVNNEDILTDTGRDPNKLFEKEDTVEQPDEDDPIVTLDVKNKTLHSNRNPIQTRERVDESVLKEKESAKKKKKKDED